MTQMTPLNFNQQKRLDNLGFVLACQPNLENALERKLNSLLKKIIKNVLYPIILGKLNHLIFEFNNTNLQK
jgi:hypothetical protein